MNAQIIMRLITSKYRSYKFIHTASCTAHTDRSPTYYFSGTACGRYRYFVSLKITPGVWPLSNHKAAFCQAQISATLIAAVGQGQPFRLVLRREIPDSTID